MNSVLQLLKAHKGKLSTGTVALVVGAWLLSRGCDIEIHVDPASARTNDAPAQTNEP
jgi:hypothetical protein